MSSRSPRCRWCSSGRRWIACAAILLATLGASTSSGQCTVTVSPPGPAPYQASATGTASGADYLTMTLIHYQTGEQEDCIAEFSRRREEEP